MIDRSMDIYSDIWYIHFIGVKRMEFDEEFVIATSGTERRLGQWSRPNGPSRGREVDSIAPVDGLNSP